MLRMSRPFYGRVCGTDSDFAELRVRNLDAASNYCGIDALMLLVLGDRRIYEAIRERPQFADT